MSEGEFVIMQVHDNLANATGTHGAPKLTLGRLPAVG
jgi:hypothetical protein